MTADELAQLPVSAMSEVRRPAAWAKRWSPSGLYVVKDADEPSYQIWYESRLEQFHMLDLSWDPLYRLFSSQPLALTWTDDDLVVNHIPDLVAERVGQSTVLIDCRPDNLQSELDFTVGTVLSRLTCRLLLDWEYEVRGSVALQRAWNLEHLALFDEVPPHIAIAAEQVAQRTEVQFRTVAGFLRAAGQACDDPAGALWHAIWRRLVLLDLSLPVRIYSRLERAAGAS